MKQDIDLSYLIRSARENYANLFYFRRCKGQNCLSIMLFKLNAIQLMFNLIPAKPSCLASIKTSILS